MNLLEHYIVRIHGVKEFEKHPNMLEVDVTCDCWGDKRRIKHITSEEQWQKDVQKGYFIA